MPSAGYTHIVKAIKIRIYKNKAKKIPPSVSNASFLHEEVQKEDLKEN